MSDRSSTEPEAATREGGLGSGLIGRIYLSPDLKRTTPLLVAIIAVCIYAAAASDTFLTVNNIQNVFGQVAVLGVLGVGTTLLMIAGKLDLSIGSAVSLLSVVGAKLLTEAGVDELVAAVAVVALGILIGVVIASITLATGVQPFILTLGGLSVFAAIALIISNSKPIASGLSYASLSTGEVGPVPTPALIFIGVSLIASVLLRFTMLGRRIYAMGSNPHAAYLAGVPVRSTTIIIFAINGALVGLAGLLLLARIGSGDPNGGLGLELQVITAVVLGGATLTGGRGTILGTFLGVMLLGVIGNSLQVTGVPAGWAQFVFGMILVIAVTWAALRERAAARARRSSVGDGGGGTR